MLVEEMNDVKNVTVLMIELFQATCNDAKEGQNLFA